MICDTIGERERGRVCFSAPLPGTKKKRTHNNKVLRVRRAMNNIFLYLIM